MLIKEKTGLVVVDVQGKLAYLVDESDTLISNCRKLIKGVQVLGLPIVSLEQNSEKLGATVDELNDLLSDAKPIQKFTFNACNEPKFVEAVQVQTTCGSWVAFNHVEITLAAMPTTTSSLVR